MTGCTHSVAPRFCLLASALLLPLACTQHVARKDLLAQIEAGTAPPIVDVRTRGEYTASHVP